MENIGIVWFRNDLRLTDNEALVNAVKNADQVLPVYVFDIRIFGGKTHVYDFPKTDVFRLRFIIESVANLRENLKKRGSELLVKVGIPEEIVAQLADSTKASWVFCNREMTDEEIKVQDRLERNLWKMGRELVFNRGKMLYYTADLPFPIAHTPDIFTNFRKEVEKFVKVREPLAIPADLKKYRFVDDYGEIPSVEDFGMKNPANTKFQGGETSGLEQLDYYIWKTKNVKKYKETRNELSGWDYSTKFSPWLAAGCISPKTIYHEIKKFEKTHGGNESTYWVNFELLWRDFFRLMGKKYGVQIFQEGGLARKKLKYVDSDYLFDAWASGLTGVPFIDANMRELNTTGFMSNRGRQNVASFLCKDLNINWLKGAEYFESKLLDYDPCSNYGNWNYVAGVGNDPREDRYFNVVSQGKRYDENGDFIKEWIPELSNVPAELIHTPWIMDTEQQITYNVTFGKDYPQPVIPMGKILRSA
jgi:deoxyribodipyrimidine photo-lyase